VGNFAEKLDIEGAPCIAGLVTTSTKPFRSEESHAI
jgi:hypothetical protein